ncbi:hypothetical protein MMC11_005391 [Xylographa trunciseda]|nr:hypothetical protein [Xylographa trunciseda]
MATYLRPWLWPGIEKEVRQILSWKPGALSASQPFKDAPTFEDDDSNLRIQSAQVPKVVQIIKFLTFEDSVQAVVSDKATSLTAIISSTAAEEFLRKHGKRITENTRGCLIQLLQFEIVATHHGPPKDRLTLRIQELKHLGCDGEGTFGNPRPIIQQDGIRQFLHELEAFRVRVSAKRAEGRNGDREGFLQSQESTSEFEDHERQVVNSQLAFATQNPSRKSAKALSRLALGKGPTQNAEVFAAADDTGPGSSCISPEEVEQNILSLLQQPKEVEHTNSMPLLAPTLAPSVKPPGTKAKPPNTSALLALLKNNSVNRIVGPVVPNENVERHTLNESATSSDRSKAHGSPGVRVGKVGEVAGIIEKAGISAQSIWNKPRLHDIAEQNATNEVDQLESPDTFKASVPTDIVGLQPNVIVFRDTHSQNSPSPSEEAVSHIEDLEDLWHGMSHIKRKDVMIPKNQQILIDRKDCWLPPEPGSRGPVANIPVSILQTFTATVEGHPNIKTIAAVVQQDEFDLLPEPSERSMPQNDVLGSPDGTHEDEDIPISTGEWPPSSPPAISEANQLPPDSSSESTPAHVRNSMKQELPTDGLVTPPSNSRASVATERNIPEVDVRVPLGSPSKLRRHIPPERKEMHQRRKRENTYNMKLVHIDSDSDADSGTFSGTEVEVKYSNARSETDCAEEAEDSVKNGDAEPTKTSFSSDDGSSITGEQRNLGTLPPLDSDEERRSPQKAAHSRLGSKHLDVAPSNGTTHRSKLLEGLIPAKDVDNAYSSSSELETSVPNALCGRGTTVYVTQQRSTPIYISDSRNPTLQVHRTPYTNQDCGIKTRKILKKLSAEKLSNGQSMEKMSTQDSMSDSDPVTEDIIPGTYSQSNRDPKPVVDHHVPSTGEADIGAPIFHGPWVPYLSEADPKKMKESNKGQSVVSGTVDLAHINKRGFDNSANTSPNVTKRRKRRAPSKTIMIEDEQVREDPSIKARQRRREFMNRLKAQSRTCVPIPGEAPDGNGSKGPNAPLTDPVLPQSSQSNRGPSASQGLRETKTTCTQTPEATSSRSGTPWREVRVIGLERSSQVKEESTSPLQGPPNLLPSNPVDRLIYSTFQKAYPTYQGNEKHFAAMCRKIKTLETDHRMEHRSLWDDFIIRHEMEYRAYLYECSYQADDPISYEKFYHAKIDEPQFTKRIITPNNLDEVISQSLQIGDRAITSTENFSGTTVDLARNGRELQETARQQIPKVPEVRTPIVGNSLSLHSSPFRRNSSIHHSALLPQDSPLRHSSPSKQDSPTVSRLTPQPPTPKTPATQLSPILGTPHAVEKTPRSLPWKRKTLDDPSPSSRNPKRRTVLNNLVSSSEPYELQPPVRSPMRNTTAVHHPYPSTADAATTGVPATRAYPTQAIGIQKTSPQGEARKRTEVNPPLPPQPLSKRHTAALPRATATSNASSPPAAKKAVHVSPGGPAPPVLPWYLDPVNPFKSFARADASIRSGSGNGFVDEKRKQRAEATEAAIENGVVLAEMKKIDVLSWAL